MKQATLYLILFFIYFIHFQSFAQPQPLWDRTLGGTGWEQLEAASPTEDGGLIFGGFTSSSSSGNVSEPNRSTDGTGDFWVVKMDTLGTLIWERRFGGDSLDRCWKILQNTEGYLLIGETHSRQNSGDKTAPKWGNADFWVIQIRPDGSKIWDKTYGGSGRDEAYSAIETPDGGYLLLGHSDSPADGNKSAPHKGGLDLWLVKIDRFGNKLWDKSYGGEGDDDYPKNTILRADDGNYFIACGSTSGRTIDKYDPLRGVKDMWLLKIAPDGTKIWDKSYGGEDEDVVISLQQGLDGNLILAGNSRSTEGGDKTSRHFGLRDYWILKVRQSDGSIVWDRSFGGTGSDDLYAAHQNLTGYLLLAGVSSSEAGSGNKDDTLRGSNDFWLCYLDKEGNKVWDKNVGGVGADAPTSLVPLSDRSYIVSGHSESNRSFEKTANSLGMNDFWIVRLRCVFGVSLGADTIICKNTTIQLNATIPRCPNCLYQWSTGGRQAIETIRPTQTMTIRARVTDTDACETESEAEIVVIPAPDSARFVVTPPLCYGDKNGIISIDTIMGGTPPFSLIWGGDTLRRGVFAHGAGAGTHLMQLIDANGCWYGQRVEVPNPPPFSLTINEPFTLNLGDTATLSVATNTVLDTFYWSDSRLNTMTVRVAPSETKTYSFTAVDTFGCQKSVFTQIEVLKDNLWFAPNVFTPNNDGLNDHFQIFGGSFVKEIIDLQIFTRWGELIFQSPKVFPAREDAGWHGKMSNGERAQPNVYLYKAKAIFKDGREEIISGDVQVLH
jgi:gliding motility-associated-like protein